MGLDNPAGPFSPQKNIKPENLIIFDGDQRGYNPESKFDPTNQDHISRLQAYVNAMIDVMKASDDSKFTQEMKRSLFIGSILNELGHSGMLHVIVDLSRLLR